MLGTPQATSSFRAKWPTDRPAARRRRSVVWLRRLLFVGGLAATLLWADSFIAPPLFRDHLHPVLPHRVYRSAQMPPDRFAQVLDRLAIRTVINLRGPCPDFDWYQHECRVTAAAGISQEDVTFSAVRLPPPSEVRRLIEILDRAEPPLLLHCRQGVDRTGLASAIVKLLEPGCSIHEAERQLSLAFGYVAYNGTGAMRDFLRLYRVWLQRMDCTHSPDLFRYWATVEYCPGMRRGEMVCLSPLPLNGKANRGFVFHLRARNTSIESWTFRRGIGWGVRLDYHLCDPGRNVVYRGKAGLIDRIVMPGETIDFALGVPPLRPGFYELHADLIAPEGNAFCQFGNDPLILPLTVTP